MKIIPRIYDGYFENSLKSPLITVVIGPRQSGKTTTVNNFLDQIPDNRKFYLNLDSLFERDRVKSKEAYLQDRVEETLGFTLDRLKEKFYFFIDEAQKLPMIFESIKILYDRYSPRLKLIVSGSSSLELLDKTAETLAGRVQILRVYPFSMSEASLYEELDDLQCAGTLYSSIFSGSLDPDRLAALIKEYKPKSRKKMQLIDRLLTRSLFPPTFSRIAEDAMPRWLMDYIDTYLERDMRSLRDIGNIDGYRKVVAQLSSRVGSLLEYNKLGTDAGVNQITAKKYVTIWQESLIGFLLSPFFLNLSTRIKKSKKVYFFDNALVWALSGFKERQLIDAGGQIGHYFENLMIADFVKWGINLENPVSFYFWKTSRASEIDLVINTLGATIPIEIKYADTWDKKYIRAIEVFKAKHKEKNLKIPFSLIIYRGEFMALNDNVFCIPAWALC
jgi:uncharacterized protein